MPREDHPKGEVEEALADLEALGVAVKIVHHGHVWARLYCSCKAGAHQGSVSGTPKNPGNEARRLRSLVNRWEHAHEEASEENDRNE